MASPNDDDTFRSEASDKLNGSLSGLVGLRVWLLTSFPQHPPAMAKHAVKTQNALWGHIGSSVKVKSKPHKLCDAAKLINSYTSIPLAERR